jgi:hypothetical protein
MSNHYNDKVNMKHSNVRWSALTKSKATKWIAKTLTLTIFCKNRRQQKQKSLNYVNSYCGYWNKYTSTAAAASTTTTWWKFFTFTCRATAHSCDSSYSTATETTFKIGGARNSCNVLNDRFNVQFRLRHGSPTRGHNPQLSWWRTPLIFHVWTANQPTITGVHLCHKNVNFGSLKHTPFDTNQFITNHSILNGSNKTGENNIILHTNMH